MLKIDATIRKQAESEIKRLRDENPVRIFPELLIFLQRKFLATLTKEVADEVNNSESVRMLAAVIFKNFMANRGGVSHFFPTKY